MLTEPARNADEALTRLTAIYTEFGQFCLTRGSASEADTRAKVVDRILSEVLGWAEAEIQREAPIVAGYLDYILSEGGRGVVVVEAKREGLSFEVPTSVERRHRHKLSGAIRTSGETYKAIEQVQNYCGERGIRYAVATNGYAWIVFRAHREDIPWRTGDAIIFPTAAYIKDNFTEFWNLLSQPAVRGGSLERAFASPLTTPRPQFRVISSIRNPDAPLMRNRLHQPLGAFVEAVFRDIAEPDQGEQLKACYVYNHSLRVIDSDLQLVIQDSIPAFALNDGARPVSRGPADAGDFGRDVVSATRSASGTVFLLLGGIGSGKTTFLKRFFNFVGADSLKRATIWFFLDLLSAPLDVSTIEKHVTDSILAEIRRGYLEPDLETRETLLRAFRDELAVLHRTTMDPTRISPEEYERRLSRKLENWMSDSVSYVPRLLAVARERGFGTVICIDNVDQLPGTYQAQVFLLAQRLAAQMKAVTIVALREESYYAASIQKTFTAYNNRKFHIASPSFRKLIGLRMEYLERLLQLPPDQRIAALGTSVDAQDAAIVRFFDIIRKSIFVVNRNISRFIEALAFGNMREALDMFATFLYSGATDVDKMLGIYERQGSYFVAFHEFAKAIILGDRRHYRESESRILNVFDRGNVGISSHFTVLRIMRVLLAQSQATSREGRGFVRLEDVINAFADTFGDENDVVYALNRLVRKQLVQVDTRSTESISGASWVRVSSAGWYYAKFLANSFAYLDLMLEDTAFDNQQVVNQLVKISEDVDAIVDSPQDRLRKVELRLQRVDAFVRYLAAEEQKERRLYGLDRRADTLAIPVMTMIAEQFEREKAYIRDRLRQNAENRPEQLPLSSETPDPDAELAALSEGSEAEGDEESPGPLGSSSGAAESTPAS